MPDSPDYAEIGTRFLQQQAMDEVNDEYAALIKKQGEFQARQIREKGAQAADGITSNANQGLLNAGLSLGLNVVGAGADAGWFGGNNGIGVQPTYEQAVDDAFTYDWGSDAGYGGSWTGNGTPSYGDYRR